MSYHQFGAVSPTQVVTVPNPSSRTPERRISGYTSANPAPLSRRYEIAYLTKAGLIDCATRLAPAIPEFEDAFCALARGSVVATMEGPVAIEDLVPGMQAVTAEGRVETITWIGSMTLFPPKAMPGMAARRMIRITADAFGLGRPMPDLVLGPAAQLLVRGTRGPAGTARAVYAPASSFVDGVNIIEVAPVVPVTVYHVMLEHHGSLRTAGLGIEGFHPVLHLAERLGGDLSQRFMTLFPHLDGFADFGPAAHPRITVKEVEAALAG